MSCLAISRKKYCNAVFNLFPNCFFFSSRISDHSKHTFGLTCRPLCSLGILLQKTMCWGKFKKIFFFLNFLKFIIYVVGMYILRKPFKFSDLTSVSVNIIILHQIIINIIGQLKCQMAMSAKSQFLVEKCPF